MPIGNPINFIDNVESKVERYTATSNQTNFTVSSGYLIGQISVYRNGVRLVSGEDYDAINGSTVILKSGATAGDSIVFQIFDSFKVSNTVPADLGGTFANDITAPTFKGNIVGTAGTFTSGTFTSGSFSGNLTVGGVLTYDDVTNVDSVGIITARTGLKVTSGGWGLV